MAEDMQGLLFGDKGHMQKQEGREAERLFNFSLFATETPNLWILACRVRTAKLASFQHYSVVLQVTGFQLPPKERIKCLDITESKAGKG